MGLLERTELKRWQYGDIPYLEKVIHCNLSKASRVLRILGMHAHDLDLGRKTVQYMTIGKMKPKAPLRFSKTGDLGIERAFATHFVVIGSLEKFHTKLLGASLS